MENKITFDEYIVNLHQFYKSIMSKLLPPERALMTANFLTLVYLQQTTKIYKSAMDQSKDDAITLFAMFAKIIDKNIQYESVLRDELGMDEISQNMKFVDDLLKNMGFDN